MDEQKKTFPRPGDYFAIYPLSELALSETAEERIYNKVVFQCIDSNESRIVCHPESLTYDGRSYGKRVLARSDWRIDDVNELLTALGIKKK